MFQKRHFSCLNKSIFFLGLLLFYSLNAQSYESPSDIYLQEFLKRFNNDSYHAMQETPPKYNRLGQRIWPQPLFPKKYDSDYDYLDLKDQKRSNLMFYKESLRAPILESSPLSDFFGYQFKFRDNFNDLGQMNKFHLATVPWSGDYWPTYRGGIAARYNSPSYPMGDTWPEYRDVIKKYKSTNYTNPQELDNLSPAEKYDILVNDPQLSMTKYAFNESETAFQSAGTIETWFGLCHGWAPASFMLPRPQKSVEIKIENFKNQKFVLKFYPDDIKALSTMLWANAAISESHFMGGRCNDKSPKRDEIGRIISQDCFDVNPGAWHVATINQMAVIKRSFVIDATYDAEVWNQPVIEYKVKYFNPKTLQPSENLNEVIVSRSDFPNDKFRKYRSPQGQFLAGVSMELTYATETSAGHSETDSDQDDSVRIVQYVYDLELDSQGKIIGGEWYQNAHPDFIWTPTSTARATSAFESYLQSKWSGETQVPYDWQQAAPMSSSYGQPFAGVVEMLIKKSN